jgi:hypothetical protein
VYGEARASERFKTWDMLKFVKSSSDLPWVCMGDFNDVLHQHEHFGVGERSAAQMAGFHEAIDVCELADLGYEGNDWTFERRVACGSHCQVRLDRALATTSWIGRYPLAMVRHLTG